MKRIFLGSSVLAPTCRSALSDDAAERLNALQRDNAILRQEIENVRLQQELAAVGRRLPSIVLAATPFVAKAADIPVKVPPSLPVCSWCGFYAGINLGASIGQSRSTDTETFFSPPTRRRFSPLPNRWFIETAAMGLFAAVRGVFTGEGAFNETVASS
jgi:hypothetical protein